MYQKAIMGRLKGYVPTLRMSKLSKHKRFANGQNGRSRRRIDTRNIKMTNKMKSFELKRQQTKRKRNGTKGARTFLGYI